MYMIIRLLSTHQQHEVDLDLESWGRNKDASDVAVAHGMSLS